DDLDKISHVSQKVNTFVTKIRAVTKKLSASDLKVYRNRKGDICAKLWGTYITDKTGKLGQTDGMKYYLITRVAYYVEDKDADSYYNYRLQGDANIINFNCDFFKRIRYLSDRFFIRRLDLSFLQIDPEFISHCENAFNYDSISDIIAYNQFSDDVQLDDRLKFANWIASKKPQKLEISPEFFPESATKHQFLDTLIHNGNCSEFSLFYGLYAYDDFPRFPMPPTLYNQVGKFKSFYFRCFIIAPEILMNIFMERMQLRENGNIFLTMTKNMESNIVVDAIGNRMIVEHCHRKYLVKTLNLKFKAEILLCDKNVVR
ncbi:hypothetical protein PRIPAC_86446, partial [Pristionchus pacificus]|uniref:Uncharacterized protein n=1 Tax=Pristionchus pacificus TaxID=54126 RepID=A0A2A6BSJ3_PRIPA